MMKCIFYSMLLLLVPASANAQMTAGEQLVIQHQRFIHPQPQGQPLPIEATITSPAGIRKAELFCRPLGGRAFTTLGMTEIEPGKHIYRAVVPDWLTASSGLEYYITATDQLGRSASQGFVGFPLAVRLDDQRQLTREERLQSLEDILTVIRKSRQADNPGLNNDPLLERR
jgi:hypothetical protein